jgi:hypothetical protein
MLLFANRRGLDQADFDPGKSPAAKWNVAIVTRQTCTDF